MRNAPIEAEGIVPWLVSGHRISRHLPWFRGEPGVLESETRAISEFFQAQCGRSRAVIVLDVHSGYGVTDRLWFPYAKSRNPFPSLAEVTALSQVIDRSLPNHTYRIEPQAASYLTHGDLWDWIYDAQRARNPKGAIVPLTLELGSWIWVRKNPMQLFSFLGAFNPVKPHRKRRVLRRHLNLLELLFRAVVSPAAWAEVDEDRRAQLEADGKKRWFSSGLNSQRKPDTQI